MDISNLLSAVKNENIVALKSIIISSENPSELGENGLGAIHLAARMGNIEILKLLLENGIEVDLKDRKGFTAINHAELFGHEEAIKFLKDNNENDNSMELTLEKIIKKTLVEEDNKNKEAHNQLKNVSDFEESKGLAVIVLIACIVIIGPILYNQIPIWFNHFTTRNDKKIISSGMVAFDKIVKINSKSNMFNRVYKINGINGFKFKCSGFQVFNLNSCSIEMTMSDNSIVYYKNLRKLMRRKSITPEYFRIKARELLKIKPVDNYTKYSLLLRYKMNGLIPMEFIPIYDQEISIFLFNEISRGFGNYKTKEHFVKTLKQFKLLDFIIANEIKLVTILLLFEEAEVLKKLKNNGLKNWKDKYGRDCIYYGVYFGSLNILKNCPDLTDSLKLVYKNGETPMDMAIRFSSKPIIRKPNYSRLNTIKFLVKMKVYPEKYKTKWLYNKYGIVYPSEVTYALKNLGVKL